MKILMLHDCAGVGKLLSKILGNRHEFYYQSLEGKGIKAILGLVRKIRKKDMDLIHAHYIKTPAIISLLSCKPYILHAHGDDVRYGLTFMQKRAIKNSKGVFYSTPDLYRYLWRSFEKGKSDKRFNDYLPNPVDFEHFKPIDVHNKIKSAIYFKQIASDPRSKIRLGITEDEYIKTVKRLCDKEGISLTISERGIPYEDMPKFLSGYDLLFDKWTLPAYSKTALEAMAMKIPVIGYETEDFNLNSKAVTHAYQDKEIMYQWVTKQHGYDNIQKVYNSNLSRVGLIK